MGNWWYFTSVNGVILPLLLPVTLGPLCMTLLSRGLNDVARVFGGRPAMATSSLGKMQAGPGLLGYPRKLVNGS